MDQEQPQVDLGGSTGSQIRHLDRAYIEFPDVVTVSATSTPVTVAREKGVGKNLEANITRVPCIRYPINFRKKSVSTLLDSDSEVNAVHPAFVKELGLPIRPTDVRTQKIDSTTLETYRMVVAAFSMEDKANQVRFFKETFLVANVSPELVFGMSFLTLSGADIDFLGCELRWRIYITEKVLPTTRRVELMGNKKFAAAVLDPEHETYVVYVASLSFTPLASLNIHPSRRPQISGLITKEAPTNVSVEYSDFADVFSSDLASKLPKHTGINNHAIDLVDCQQPPYRPIYSLGAVELETLKAYIETNLANGFIRPSKHPAGALILFERKSDGFFQLCVDY